MFFGPNYRGGVHEYMLEDQVSLNTHYKASVFKHIKMELPLLGSVTEYVKN